MIKHYNDYFDETYYSETLANGLKVLIFHKPEFSTSVCSFATPYGALDINQKCNNRIFHFNPGIAHFLEHKIFESKGDDIISQFSAMGGDVNAFTSYQETVYYFSKSGDDIKECLNLLLDFVQSFDVSKGSVEKEKGIIIQEVSMYEQMPNSRLLNEAYKCLYHNYPIKYDIGGNKKTINAISKRELEKCYQVNYHPSNMVLMITTFIDPNKIIKIIRDNQNKKVFSKPFNPISHNIKEPLQVNRKRRVFTMDVETDKHLLAYKLQMSFKDIKEAFRKEWAIRFLLEAHFSYLNPQYQEWLDNKIINDFFGYEIDFNLDYSYIMFYIENDDSKILRKIVKQSLKQKLLDEELLNQVKRRYIGIMFDAFNDLEAFNNGYVRDYLNGLDLFENVEIIKSIDLKEVYDTFQSLDLSNSSYISLIKKQSHSKC